MSRYDAVPYESLPISFTYIPHIAGLGRLFGLHTTPPENCRVLDIGCAEGNNIIPMAWHWPESEFVGIDISEVQIQTGLKLIESLSLNNIQLHIDDISSLKTDSYGKFDYIILHGVFSWIPQELQQTLLDITQSLLSDNGIAYISYNTYPGWHSQKVIRDAMLLYCSDGDTPKEEFKMIPKALNYFKTFFTVADNEFSAFNTKRLTTLQEHSKEYIFHEFLETYNNPLYLSDFIKKAGKSHLQYVSDALLGFDNTAILGNKRNALLKNIKGRIKKLQYMDFLINQRFRRALLCYDIRPIRDSFAPENMVGLAYRGCFGSKRVAKLNSLKPCSFYQNLDKNTDKNTYLKLSHPVTKAAIQILTENFPSSLDYMDLLTQASQRVADKGGIDFVKEIDLFYQELYLLLINDWISTDTTVNTITPIDWNKPLFITDLSWQYAKNNHFLPTFLQKAIDIDELGIQALKLLRKGIIKQDLLTALSLLDTPKRSFWKLKKEKQKREELTHFLEILNKNGLLVQ